MHFDYSIASSTAVQEVQIFTSPDQASIEFAAVVSDVAEELDGGSTGRKLAKIKLFCTHTTDESNIPLFSPKEISHRCWSMKNQPTISIGHSMSFFVAIPDINHHLTNESHNYYFVTNGNQQEPTIDLNRFYLLTANNLCGY